MIDWVLLAVGVIVAVEISLHLPFKRLALNLYNSVNSTIKILRSSTYSDAQKQRYLLYLSWCVFKTTLYLFFLLVVIILPIMLIIIISEILDLRLYEILNSLLGILISVIVSLLYFYLRRVLKIERIFQA
jgi:hypothetical protein